MNKIFPPLRSRQVHLDFHTSEAVPEVGADFDKKQFIDCLKKGHVNSVTLFAMCHHGWCYYDTKVGKKHPGLKRDLLAEMLEACREADIDCPVYITEGWNELTGREHPEWVKLEKDGKMQYMPPEGKDDDPRPWGWHTICLNTPYLDYLLNITEEVITRFKPSGIFYDITGEKPCYCPACRKSMAERGWDINDDALAQKFATEVYINYLKKTTELIWKLSPSTRVFHNSDAKKGRKDLYPYFSHYEIESLPTMFWGYDHFPQNAKYYKYKNFDLLGMTGKFHISWGEFGGFKNPDALRYECSVMNALGAKCSIGDQLHPTGIMDEETYRIIGAAYQEVEKREELCLKAKSVSDIAVVSPSALLKDNRKEDAEYGASIMLLETQRQFDIVDEDADFSQYKMLILPDEAPVNDALSSKINKFLENGGKLIFSGESGLTEGQSGFNFKTDIKYVSAPVWDLDYSVVKEALAKSMVKTPFLNYKAGYMAEAGKNCEILAETLPPYFKRTYKHFCSHMNTPYDYKAKRSPAVIRNGNIIYIAHKIFSMYKDKGMKLHRDLVNNCINLLMPEKIVTTSLPSCGRVFLTTRSGADKELLLHLLYVTPVKHGGTEVIEDIIKVHNVEVSVKAEFKAKSVVHALSGKEIPFKQDGATVSFTVPELEMYDIIKIS